VIRNNKKTAIEAYIILNLPICPLKYNEVSVAFASTSTPKYFS